MKMNKIFLVKFFSILFSLIFLLNTVNILSAQEKKPGAQELFQQTGQQVYNTGTTPTELEPFVAVIIRGILTIVGVVFLLMTIYGGFLWMEARGDESKAVKARDIIVMAATGLVVVIGSYALATFIFSRIYGAVTR